MNITEAAYYMLVNNINPLDDGLFAYKALLDAGFCIGGSSDDRIDTWEKVNQEYKRLKHDKTV